MDRDPVEQTKRPAMSKSRRLRIWEREKGICYICGKKVQANEKWDAEHVRAWELYKDDSDENIRVAHKEKCHKEKTDSDLKIMRKADRQAGRKGQWARRQSNGSQLKGRGFEKPKDGYKWPSRGFDRRKPK